MINRNFVIYLHFSLTFEKYNYRELFCVCFIQVEQESNNCLFYEFWLPKVRSIVKDCSFKWSWFKSNTFFS